MTYSKELTLCPTKIRSIQIKPAINPQILHRNVHLFVIKTINLMMLIKQIKMTVIKSLFKEHNQTFFQKYFHN